MAPLLERHLNTNYVPSDTERREIFRILQEPQARLSKINDEIERMEATLEEMKRQRDELSQHIDQYRALTSPIRRLPQEILLEIFIHCLPKDHNTFMSSHEAPLLLGRICSRWRSVSLSARQLWTTIHVPVPAPAEIHPEQVITKAEHIVASKRMIRLRTAALQEWLNRSGSLPVDISCNQWAEAITADFVNTAQPIVDVILSVAHRWRNVTMAAPADTMVSFLSYPSHNLPFLESLNLIFIWRWEPGLSIQPSEYNICGAPSLRKLSFEELRANPLKLPVNWEHLTDLSLKFQTGSTHQLPLHEAAELLSRCRHLVRCTLAMGQTYEVPPVQLSSFTLPYLECFTIFEVTYATSVFSCLDLPELCQVTYYTAVAPHSSRRSSLLTLLEKSNGSIRELKVNPQQFTRGELIECLRLIPHATILTFDNRTSRHRKAVGAYGRDPTILHKDLLYSFLPSATMGPLCPKLQVLHVSPHLDVSDEDLLEFTLEKQRGASSNLLPLKRLQIDFIRPQRMNVMAHLKMMKDFDLQLRYAARSMETLFSPSEMVDIPDVGYSYQ